MKLWAWPFICSCCVVLLWMSALSILCYLDEVSWDRDHVFPSVSHSLRYLDDTQEIINNLRPILLRDQQCFWPIWCRGSSMQEVKEVSKVRVGVYRVSGNFLRHTLKQVFFRFRGKAIGNMHRLPQTYMCVETFSQIWPFMHISVSTSLETFFLIYAKSY